MHRVLFSIPLLVACGGGKAGPQPPAAPAGVIVQAGDGQATVLWDAIPGAIGYRVHLAQGANLTPGDAGTATSFAFVGLTNGVTYSISVSAIGPGGEGPQSAPVSGTPQA